METKKKIIFIIVIILIFVSLVVTKIFNNSVDSIQNNIGIALNYAYNNNIMSEDSNNQISNIINSKNLMALNPRYWSDKAENNFNNNSVTENFQIINIEFLKYDVFKSEFIFRIVYIYQQYDKMTNELIYESTAGNNELYVIEKDNDWYISYYRPSP